MSNGAKSFDGGDPEFIAATIHQLRSPITIFRGYLQLLVDAGSLNEQQRAYIRDMTDVSQHMLNIVNDFLDMAKLESRTVAFQFAEFSLAAFLEKLVAEFEPLIAKKGIRVEKNFEDLTVSSDEKFLRHALINLISNAVKYTPEKGAVKLTAKRAGDDFVVRIGDSGYGIPDDEQPKIFQRFFRASNIVQHEPMGTGLGLWITKLIVDQMGGNISFVSKVDEGTTFTVRLPIIGRQITFGYSR